MASAAQQLLMALGASVSAVVASGVGAALAVGAKTAAAVGSSSGIGSATAGSDETGWTVFTASAPSGEGDTFAGAGTRKIYVSQSTGSDSNAGTQASPYLTIAKGVDALRDGKPDWLLLNCGDTWTNQTLGRIEVGGLSETEPMLISSYGTGARPLIKTNSTVDGLQFFGGTSGDGGDYLAVVGIELYAYKRDPANPSFVDPPTDDPVGIFCLNPLHWLLIEDCKISFYTDNVAIQMATLGTYVALRRNVIVDAYSPTGSHAEGMYLENPTNDGLLIEENILDHNGWHATQSGGGKTVFNHNCYIQNDSAFDGGTATFIGNITTRASSHGVQLRPGGTASDNLVSECAIGILIGGGDEPLIDVPDVGSVTDNVITQGTDIGGTALGWGIDIAHSNNVVTTGNIIAHQQGTGGNGIGISIQSNGNSGTIQTNIVFDWDSGISNGGSGNTVSSNDIDLGGTNNNPGGNAPSEPFPTPTRDVGDYAASIGLTGTLAAFLTAARDQRKGNWNPALMAAPVITYIRTGFGL